jgi:hypothetical protein
MKTVDIMNAYEYESVGGPIQAIPVSDVIQFLQRIEDRLNDIENGMTLQQFAEEMKQVQLRLTSKMV